MYGAGCWAECTYAHTQDTSHSNPTEPPLCPTPHLHHTDTQPSQTESATQATGRILTQSDTPLDQSEPMQATGHVVKQSGLVHGTARGSSSGGSGGGGLSMQGVCDTDVGQPPLHGPAQGSSRESGGGSGPSAPSLRAADVGQPMPHGTAEGRSRDENRGGGLSAHSVCESVTCSVAVSVTGVGEGVMRSLLARECGRALLARREENAAVVSFTHTPTHTYTHRGQTLPAEGPTACSHCYWCALLRIDCVGCLA